VHCAGTETGNKFWDDCGAWSGSSGPRAQSMGEVRPLPNGLHGRQKRVEGTRIVAEIDPQPSEVIQFHQLCSRLKRNNNYQRRITYLENSDCYIAEYLGTFPTDVEAHGNAVFSTGEYVRSKPEVMMEIAERLKQSAARPNIIYHGRFFACVRTQICVCTRTGKRTSRYTEVNGLQRLSFSWSKSEKVGISVCRKNKASIISSVNIVELQVCTG